MPSITLDAQPSNIAVARRFVDGALAGVAVDRNVAVLLVSELVTNVILHAATQFEVVVTVDEVVRVTVADGAAITASFRDRMANPPEQVNAGAPGGRGMMLLSQLASRFGLEDRGSAGKAVWFELPLQPTSHPTHDTQDR